MATNQTTVKSKIHNLTKDERLTLGDEIAETLNKIDAKTKEKEASSAKFKAEEKELAIELDKQRERRAKGYEELSYICHVVSNAANQTIEFVVAEGQDKGDSRRVTFSKNALGTRTKSTSIC